MRTVIIQQADLDTCLTALILGITEGINLETRHSEANIAELENLDIFCIEAGGSGWVERSNFDHHDPATYYPPACYQALIHTGIKNRDLERLTDYVCHIDECRPFTPVSFPSLSGIFSGMRLTETSCEKQLFEGIGILRTVLDEGLDPFRSMPERGEWHPYLNAKRQDVEKKNLLLKSASIFSARSGTKIGFMEVPPGETGAIGGFGALYRMGCEVAILFHPAFGEPPVRKFTIAGNGRPVSLLLPYLTTLEPGWGGRETIIGSPRTGTSLETGQVLQLVMEKL